MHIIEHSSKNAPVQDKSISAQIDEKFTVQNEKRNNWQKCHFLKCFLFKGVVLKLTEKRSFSTCNMLKPFA